MFDWARSFFTLEMYHGPVFVVFELTLIFTDFLLNN